MFVYIGASAKCKGLTEVGYKREGVVIKNTKLASHITGLNIPTNGRMLLKGNPIVA